MARIASTARPAQYANDGIGASYWQSAPAGGATTQYTANLTFDLLIEQVGVVGKKDAER